MDYVQIAELLRAAGRGQTAPFMQSGASWSGNAYIEAEGRAASFNMMAEVFEKIGLANQEGHNQPVEATMEADHSANLYELRINELVAALKPFADWGAKMVGSAAYGDACPLTIGDPDNATGAPTVGDLRRAFTILNG